MLVLTRKRRETILIDDRITLTILAVSGKNVRIGIEAPENVRIVRGEIHERDETKKATLEYIRREKRDE